MKRFVSILLAVLILLVCAGCRSDEAAIYEYAWAHTDIPEEPLTEMDYDDPGYMGAQPDEIYSLDAAEGDDLSGELVIKSFLWEEGQGDIGYLAQEFMQLHPGVSITFDCPVTRTERRNMTLEQRAEAMNAFCERLRVELLSGEADYLLFDVPEGVDLAQLSRNGILTDMRPWYERDMDENDYFTQVLEAFTVDGAMTVFPFAFRFYTVYLNRAVLEELDLDLEEHAVLNSDDILDWYERLLPNHPDMNLFFTSPGKDTLFEVERMRYIDLDNNVSSFDSPEFVTFLERTQNTLNSDPDLEPVTEIGRGYGGLADRKLLYDDTGVIHADVLYQGSYGSPESRDGHAVTRSRPFFASLDSINIYQFMDFQHPREYMAGPFPFTSTDGKMGLISEHDFAIPGSMRNKELAWEFINYCISDREEMSFAYLGGLPVKYTEDIPVNKHNFENQAQYFVEHGHTPSGYSTFEPVDMSALTEDLETVLSLPLVNARRYGTGVQEYLDEFYINELTTAGQCAEKIQDRTEIWLFE